MTDQQLISESVLALVIGPVGDGSAETWQQKALCPQTDPDAFFPENGGSTQDAKAICRRCPVIDPCRNYALDHEVRFGVWGGLSENERRAILRTRRRKQHAGSDIEAERRLAG